MTEGRIIYGDGRMTVEVTADRVLFSYGDVVLGLSRAAFREVVLGWQRLLEQEDEADD